MAVLAAVSVASSAKTAASGFIATANALEHANLSPYHFVNAFILVSKVLLFIFVIYKTVAREVSISSTIWEFRWQQFKERQSRMISKLNPYLFSVSPL